MRTTKLAQKVLSDLIPLKEGLKLSIK